MKQRMIYSSCPHCGHDFQILRDTYEIAEMNPIAEQRLQEETYFLHQCNVCHKLYYLQYPFLYRNTKEKYILVLSQQETLPDFPKDEKVIRVKQARHFPFVYKVMKYHLDLKEVLKIQKQIQEKVHADVKLDSYHKGNLWFIKDGELIGVPYKKGGKNEGIND